MFAAAVCAVLSATGTLSSISAEALVLGILSVVLLGMVNLRTQIINAFASMSKRDLTVDMPPELEESIRRSDQDVLLIGPSLNRTLIKFSESLVKCSGNVRIALTDPQDEISVMAIARRRTMRGTATYVRSDIESGLEMAKHIRDAGQSVEVRVVSQPLPTGFILLEPHGHYDGTRLFWEIYQIKGDTGSQPCAWLQPGDQVFDALISEARNIWQSGKILS